MKQEADDLGVGGAVLTTQERQAAEDQYNALPSHMQKQFHTTSAALGLFDNFGDLGKPLTPSAPSVPSTSGSSDALSDSTAQAQARARAQSDPTGVLGGVNGWRSAPTVGWTADHRQSGGSGDCYFLSAMNAVASTTEGKTLLANSIKQTAFGTNGAWDVHFAGAPGKTYHVTADELNGPYARYATGDAKTDILQAAADKWSKEKNGKGLFDGGRSEDVLSLLTGHAAGLTLSSPTAREDLRSAFLSLRPGQPATFDACNDGSKHVFAVHDIVSGADPKNPTVVWTNPWNSGDVRRTPLDDLLKPGAIDLGGPATVTAVSYLEPP